MTRDPINRPKSASIQSAINSMKWSAMVRMYTPETLAKIVKGVMNHGNELLAKEGWQTEQISDIYDGALQLLEAARLNDYDGIETALCYLYGTVPSHLLGPYAHARDFFNVQVDAAVKYIEMHSATLREEGLKIID